MFILSLTIEINLSFFIIKIKNIKKYIYINLIIYINIDI